ncbi:hypothetical protein RF11_02835 [Thelohanellus kitauei]|uniref:Uncharacterized protein n=1 Tax=Thelohanellus kitauei TaxID=669202 RepID=A0A0C2ISY4_THEKT|nr:hypothetical protein RF11_02835 [Thelohanellus kitauei]
MLGPLAFVETQRVFEYFEVLEDELERQVTSRKIFIDRFHRRIRSAPVYDINMWNQKNRVAQSLQRTNNAIEGWHRAFSNMVDSHHPNIYKFLEFLKKEQALVDYRLDIAQYLPIIQEPDHPEYRHMNREL